jgi:subtilisin family serine protease
MYAAVATVTYASNGDEVISSHLPAPAVYAELEESADGKAYVIVMLESTAGADATTPQRRAAVKKVQERVLSKLGPGEFTVVYKYENVSAMTGWVNAAGLAKLVAEKNVAAVGPDGTGHAHLSESVPFIGADVVHAQGYTGTGITVAVLDTGIDMNTPDVADDIAPGWYHFLDGGGNVGPGAQDDNLLGHGTNVAGIITSKGLVAPVGVAPDADILAIKVLKKDGSGKISDWARGVDYVVTHQADYDNLCIINMSLGSDDLFGQCPCDSGNAYTLLLQASLQAAKNSGIVTFASSGNNGKCTSMSSPACLSAATAVAAVYDQDLGREPDSGTYWCNFTKPNPFADCYDATTAGDKITCFSNRSGCNELAAPGRNIKAPGRSGGTSTLTGTSQASPHCAGVAALMHEKAATLGIPLSPDKVVQIMKDTGVPTLDECGTYPNPIRVDANEAVSVVGSEPKPEAKHLKWSQPPLAMNPSMDIPVYCGWNEESWTQDPCSPFRGKEAADDFRCLGDMPVTSIHWWGSHREWWNTFPPPQQPIGWWLRFWSNVAANPAGDPNYSHPGWLLWEIQVDAERVHTQWVGSDEYPMMPPESCFQYYVDLEPNEYFRQNDYNDMTVDNIFWLGISAVYADDVNVVYPWGWKTRPQHWMDDGVKYECRVVGWDPGPPPFPIILCRFWPIKDALFGESYDLAFELGTSPNHIKWEQPFEGIGRWPHYEDELSMATVQRWTEYKWAQMPDLGETGLDVDATYCGVVGDDFPCTTTEPITDIHIWGSWYYDETPLGDPNAVTFRLSIYSDNPVGPNGWSEPNELLWWRDFPPGQFDVSLHAGELWEGWYVPCEEYWEWPADSMCWQYDFYIDPCEAFLQRGSADEAVVYWLVVKAYPEEESYFGVKTSLDYWNDNAVWAFEGGPWQELRYPVVPVQAQQEDRIDLAFAITTGDEDVNTIRLVADDWRCKDKRPVTEAVWWGSYIGYQYQPCQDWLMIPPVKPDYFELKIWDDVPAGVDLPFSHPNNVIWEYKAYEYDEVMVGYDKHPELEPPLRTEPVFRYSVQLPKTAWFRQKDVNDIYWFSVVAVYESHVPNYDWGWTNHEYGFNDSAVERFRGLPGGWFWDELSDQTGAREDMSFVLFAPEWPECWGYLTQCHGDSDNTGWVKGSDFLALKNSWYKVYPDPLYNPCADFDRNGEVKGSDFLILKNNWYQSPPSNCAQGGKWPP